MFLALKQLKPRLCVSYLVLFFNRICNSSLAIMTKSIFVCLIYIKINLKAIFAVNLYSLVAFRTAYFLHILSPTYFSIYHKKNQMSTNFYKNIKIFYFLSLKCPNSGILLHFATQKCLAKHCYSIYAIIVLIFRHIPTKTHNIIHKFTHFTCL